MINIILSNYSAKSLKFTPLLMRLFFYASVLLIGLSAVIPNAQAQRFEPLPIENAFNFNVSATNDIISIRYFMPSGIYLYRNKFNISIQSSSVELKNVIIPQGEFLDDPLFGKTTVFFNDVTLLANVSGSGALTLLVYSQGCDKETGICYPPALNSVALMLDNSDVSATESNTVNTNNTKDEAGDLAKSINEKNIFLVILLFFALGVGLSLTPCVLPMIPILLGIIGSTNKDNKSRAANAMPLTLSYVAGVTSIFTITGVLAASSGQLLATQVQTPPFIIGISVVFFLLALSMFGLYDIKPPAIFHRFYDNANKKGGIIGAFFMGGLSVIVISPCISAPLVGVLIYIANTGNTVIGAVSLFALALGMSTLLLLLGLFGDKILPKPGVWMTKIKHILGLMLLCVTVWTAAPLIPDWIEPLLYGFLLIIIGLIGAPLSGLSTVDNFMVYIYKAMAWAVLLIGSVLLMGGFNVVNPFASFSSVPFLSPTTNNTAVKTLNFKVVTTPDGLQQQLANSTTPIMIEFYADWCVSCKEFEYYTLSDNRVQAQLKGMKLIKVDVTDNTEDSKALLAQFDLFGPPGIFFLDAAGRKLEGIRIIGYENADSFLQTLDVVLQRIKA